MIDIRFFDRNMFWVSIKKALIFFCDDMHDFYFLYHKSFIVGQNVTFSKNINKI